MSLISRLSALEAKINKSVVKAALIFCDGSDHCKVNDIVLHRLPDESDDAFFNRASDLHNADSGNAPRLEIRIRKAELMA